MSLTGLLIFEWIFERRGNLANRALRRCGTRRGRAAHKKKYAVGIAVIACMGLFSTHRIHVFYLFPCFSYSASEILPQLLNLERRNRPALFQVAADSVQHRPVG